MKIDIDKRTLHYQNMGRFEEIFTEHVLILQPFI